MRSKPDRVVLYGYVHLEPSRTAEISTAQLTWARYAGATEGSRSIAFAPVSAADQSRNVIGGEMQKNVRLTEEGLLS